MHEDPAARAAAAAAERAAPTPADWSRDDQRAADLRRLIAILAAMMRTARRSRQDSARSVRSAPGAAISGQYRRPDPGWSTTKAS